MEESTSFKLGTQSVREYDDRIVCSNSNSVDNILSVVASHVEQLSNSINLGSEKSQFVSRVLDIFGVNIQENITINGLPYTANKESFSIKQKRTQEQETKDALLAKLSKKVHVVASKRKRSPRVFCEILEKKLTYHRHNVETTKISNLTYPFPVMEQPFNLDLLSVKKMEDVDKKIKSSKIEITAAVEELKEIQQNIKFAEKIVSQKPYNEALCDTGYNSS